MIGNKTVKGTKDFKVVKGSIDPRQLRCKKCGNLAVAAPDGKGGTVTTCPSCKTQYASTPMSP